MYVTPKNDTMYKGVGIHRESQHHPALRRRKSLALPNGGFCIGDERLPSFACLEGTGGLQRKLAITTPSRTQNPRTYQTVSKFMDLQRAIEKLSEKDTLKRGQVFTQGDKCLKKVNEALQDIGLKPNKLEGYIHNAWAPFIFMKPQKKDHSALPDVYIPVFPKLTPKEKAAKGPTFGKNLSKLKTPSGEGIMLHVPGDTFRRWCQAFLMGHGDIYLGKVTGSGKIRTPPKKEERATESTGDAKLFLKYQ